MGDFMRSIASFTSSLYEIHKSKFYCLLYPVTDLKMVHRYLEEAKTTYPNATHYCYAYIVGNQKHCSDDGEPSKTAGMPILNVLEKQNLHFILCIVVRYFGGILLGAGGLVRAYTNAVVKTLDSVSYVDFVLGKELLLTFSYVHKKMVDSILGNFDLLDANYQEQITYHIQLANVNLKDCLERLTPFVTYQILDDCYCIKKVQDN